MRASCGARWPTPASSRRSSIAPTLPDDDVLAALAALPPDQRAVIVMRHLLGFTPGEIASALGLPRGTVNSRLRRGLDGLQEAVER